MLRSYRRGLRNTTAASFSPAYNDDLPSGWPPAFCSFNGDHTPDPDNGQAGNSWVYQEVWNFFSQF